MAVWLSRLGAFAVRRRVPVVLTWLAVLVAGVAGAATLSGATSTTFSIPGQESTRALDRIGHEFPGAGGATAQVVVRAPEGATLTAAGEAAAVSELVGALNALPGVASATDPLDPAAPTVDANQTLGFSTVTFDAATGAVTSAQQDALLGAVDDARESGLTVEAGGDALTSPTHLGGIAEVAGVVIALVVLAVTYGTLVAAGMNLLTAVVGVGVGVLGITIVTGFIELSATTSILAGMLGLAVGIDYALFIISRFRQALRQGADVPAAVGTAVGTAGSAVVTAGLTVVIALVGLAVAGIPFLTQMGVAGAATIAVAVLVALTLVPAVLGMLGTRLLPTSERVVTSPVPADTDGSVQPGVYRRWISGVTRRRWTVLATTVAVLALMSVPLFSLRTTLVVQPPADTTQARAGQLIAGGFGAGFGDPLSVLFEGPNAEDAANTTVVAISDLDDVATVSAPVANSDSSAALMTVVPATGPTSRATEQLVVDLRAQLSTLEAPGITTAVTGQTAVSVDVATSLNRALPAYLILVVGLALALLVLVFRSVLVPAIGVLGFLLTVGASLGATVAVFQWGWLADLINLDSTGPLIGIAPILVIGILFGLAMDYQVFLVSRMHENHSRGMSPLEAVGTGFRQAAPVVVAAALIMFSVFAGFVPSGDATVKAIAFALAIGVLIDAFVVRMLLVPAALVLLGEKAWWLPSWLQWLPQLDVEGTTLAGADTRPAPRASKRLNPGES